MIHGIHSQVQNSIQFQLLQQLKPRQAQKPFMKRQMKQTVILAGWQAHFVSAAHTKDFFKGSLYNETQFSCKYVCNVSIPLQNKEKHPNLGQHFATSSFDEKNNFCHRLSLKHVQSMGICISDTASDGKYLVAFLFHLNCQ